MQTLLLATLVVLWAARASAGSPPPPPPAPTSEAAPANATPADAAPADATSGALDASPPPPGERATRPTAFVPSPQLGVGPTDAAVDGWLVSAPLRQPPLGPSRAAAAVPQRALLPNQLANVFDAPAPEHQDSEFRPMVHHKLRGPVLAETPGGAPGQHISAVADPVEEYLGAMKAQLGHHGTTGTSRHHGQGHLEQSTDDVAVQEYLKAVQADFAAVHQHELQQQQQQADGDFPAVWGESKAGGKPVRFEQDVSLTRPLPPEAARGGGRLPGEFPYQYERPAGGIPEVAEPIPIGPKHHGRKKVGVARPSPRSGVVQKVLHALAAFIPLGLFLASIQPSVITVNASAPAPGVTRQRSLAGGGAAGEAGVLLAAGAAGADCEARLLCEAAARGRRGAAAEPSERALWLAAHRTPDKMAEALGLYNILKAIRTGTCDLIDCNALQDQQFASSI